MITPKNLIRHELIGLRMKVSASANRTLSGAEGKVVDETKGMLTMKTSKGTKKVSKKGSEFIFTLPDERKVKVEGRVIEKKPEDRVKIKVRKW